MVNINKLKGKMVEMETNATKLAPKIGMDTSTFYRRLSDGGEGFTIAEVDALAKALQLDRDEVNAIFFSEIVA